VDSRGSLGGFGCLAGFAAAASAGLDGAEDCAKGAGAGEDCDEDDATLEATLEYIPGDGTLRGPPPAWHILHILKFVPVSIPHPLHIICTPHPMVQLPCQIRKSFHNKKNPSNTLSSRILTFGELCVMLLEVTKAVKQWNYER